MSSTILKLMLLLGIIGHACNMYCDRILSIFPNGQLKLENFKDLTNEKKMAHLLECVSQKIPMRSAILGAFSLFLQFLGYFSLSAYMYGHSRLYGSILFVSIAFFIVIGTAAFPLWAVIFTILPIFILLFPFRIIGTLHIAAMASMLVWLVLI